MSLPSVSHLKSSGREGAMNFEEQQRKHSGWRADAMVVWREESPGHRGDAPCDGMKVGMHPKKDYMIVPLKAQMRN
jgi:hypothetical protein